MSFPPDLRITTGLLLQGALLFAVLDSILAPILVWRVKTETFHRLKRKTPLFTALFWCGLWFWVIAAFWDQVYQYVFPGWSRWILPFFMAGLTTLAAWLAWQIASRTERIPVLAHLLCGGAWGALTHLWAVSRGIVEKPPMLQGAAPAAAVFIAVFEYIFYWCIILILAALADAAQRWIQRLHAARPENGII